MRFLRFFVMILFVVSLACTVYINISVQTDYSGPVLKCDSDIISVSVHDSNEEILSHVSAIDEKDGDITSEVIIESISAFIGKNKAKVIFAVCDSDNNVTKLESDIVYTDYTNPVFSFDSQQVYYTGAARVDLLNGVHATDLLDGDISSRIVIANSEIDLSLPGVYPLTYKVTTSKGVTSEITVNAYVYSSKLKYPIKLSEYLVYTDSNHKIEPMDYVVEYPEELFDEDYKDNYDYTFDIIDDVDYSKSGIYNITYRVSRVEKKVKGAEVEILAEAYLSVAVRGEK